MNTFDLDKTYIASTYKRFPVEIVSGKGSLVTDVNGKQYIDMGSGIAVTSFGVADDERGIVEGVLLVSAWNDRTHCAAVIWTDSSGQPFHSHWLLASHDAHAPFAFIVKELRHVSRTRIRGKMTLNLLEAA